MCCPIRPDGMNLSKADWVLFFANDDDLYCLKSSVSMSIVNTTLMNTTYYYGWVHQKSQKHMDRICYVRTHDFEINIHGRVILKLAHFCSRLYGIARTILFFRHAEEVTTRMVTNGLRTVIGRFFWHCSCKVFIHCMILPGLLRSSNQSIKLVAS